MIVFVFSNKTRYVLCCRFSRRTVIFAQFGAQVRSFAKRQILNSQDEVRNKDPRIKIKAEEIKRKRTRETQISAHDIMSKKKAKRQQHIDKREKALSYCVPTEPMKTMRQRRIEKQSGRI